MGCGTSQLAGVYLRDDVREHKEFFEGLAFRELDIARLHKTYRRIDNDKSGEIEIAELLAFLDLEKTRFTKRIFSIFDEDGSGLINFREFVLSLWNYCTLTKASLMMFAFDLYDKDQSGSIAGEEVIDMLHDLYGKEFKQNPQARLVERELEMLHRKDGAVSIEDFTVFARNHPALLFHAFRMQESIQDFVLGRTFWEYYSERRIEISKGRLYVPVSEFVQLHINKKLKDAVLNKNIGLGDDPRLAAGYVPPDDPHVAPPGLRKFEGKISDNAANILASTGSLARRKGTEVEKWDSALARTYQAEQHKQSEELQIIEDRDFAERSYESKVEYGTIRAKPTSNAAQPSYGSSRVVVAAGSTNPSRRGSVRHDRRSFDALSSSVQPTSENQPIARAGRATMIETSTKKSQDIRHKHQRRSFDGLPASK